MLPKKMNKNIRNRFEVARKSAVVAPEGTQYWKGNPCSQTKIKNKNLKKIETIMNVKNTWFRHLI